MGHKSVIDLLSFLPLTYLLEIAQARGYAGVLPCFAKIPDWLALNMKNKKAFGFLMSLAR
jgi:hypothetical protein